MSDDKKNPDDFSEEFGAEDDDDFSLPSFDEEDSSGLSTSDSSGESFSSSDSSSSSSDEFVGSIFSTESSDDTGSSDSSQEDGTYSEGTDEYKYEDEDEEEEKKPNSKGFIIVIVIVCIVLLGGGFAYLYLHQQKGNPLEGIAQEEILASDSTQLESDSLGGVASDPSTLDVASEEDTEDNTEDVTEETKEEVQKLSETPSTPSDPSSSSQASNTLNSPDGRFYIIIASFSFKKSAEDKANDISRQGYTPKIIMPFQNSPYYRVAIEGFHSHAEAHRHIAKYRGQFGRSAWVLDYSR